jgi:hypothetical protein
MDKKIGKPSLLDTLLFIGLSVRMMVGEHLGTGAVLSARDCRVLREQIARLYHIQANNPAPAVEVTND